MNPWEGSPRPPRRWQTLALPAVSAAWKESVPGPAWRDWYKGGRPIVRACTGSGKSALLAEIATLMSSNPSASGDVVITAPRESLVEQLSGFEGLPSFRPGSVAWRAGGHRVGVYYGPRKDPSKPITVTCNPSLAGLVALRGARPCGLLIVDEAHRSESDQFRAAVDALKPRRIVGFSATPWRSDSSESLELFDRVAYDYGLPDALRDGVLVPWVTEGYDGDGEPEIDRVCVDLIRRFGEGPGVCSAASIADATAYALRLSLEGIPSLPIHSELSRGERRSRIDRLLSGEVRCLVHVALVTEGVDIPELRWLCMRRPTSTAIRFVQELGRVLRTAPGKSFARLLDPYDFEGSIGLVHDAAIGPAEGLESMMRGEVTPRGEVDPDAERPAFPPAVAVSQVTRWARRALLGLVEAGIAPPPTAGGRWRATKPSDKQLTTLRRIGGDEARAVLRHESELSRGEVSDMIGLLSVVRARAREGRPVTLPPVPPDALASLAERKVRRTGRAAAASAPANAGRAA